MTGGCDRRTVLALSTIGTMFMAGAYCAILTKSKRNKSKLNSKSNKLSEPKRSIWNSNATGKWCRMMLFSILKRVPLLASLSLNKIRRNSLQGLCDTSLRTSSFVADTQLVSPLKIDRHIMILRGFCLVLLLDN